MFKTPIIILAYNRAKNLKKLIEILKGINALNIYISCDGPKNNFIDQNNCLEVKKIINTINWKCNLEKNYIEKNYGCKNGVSKGLDWFFSKEDFGIILEDDCVPSIDFFNFCEWGLIKYKNSDSIGGITGNNFLRENISIKESFYYSKYAHCWGWATWRRVWKKYDKNIEFWKKFKLTKEWSNIFKQDIERRYWTKIFNNVVKKKIDSWAYPWNLCVWKYGKVIITPKVNLVKNVGFDKEATHTTNTFQKFDYNVSKLIKPYTEPAKLEINQNADKYVFENHFQGKNYLWPYRMNYILKYFFFNPVNFTKKLIKLSLNSVK